MATTRDVVIVGDGPAGLALGAACVGRGLDALVVGAGRPWTATYGAWADEVPEHQASFASRTSVDVVALTRIELHREYVVFDNVRLRAALDIAPRAEATITSRDDLTQFPGRLVVDATGGRPALLEPRLRARTRYQSAYGIVLERPLASPVLMDWTPVADGEPTFLYAVPVDSTRWLFEETSLIRDAPMEMGELRRRLATRLGADLTDAAERVEEVVIPMTTGVPRRSQPVVGFGAAAGFVHPATGYSVAASLRAAPRVADALASGDALAAWNKVWPADARRVRALHDHGAAALVRMNGEELRAFFEAFFRLPQRRWAEFLRLDASPRAAGGTMNAVFRSLPWSVRRQLIGGIAARREPSRRPRRR